MSDEQPKFGFKIEDVPCFSLFKSGLKANKNSTLYKDF